MQWIIAGRANLNVSPVILALKVFRKAMGRLFKEGGSWELARNKAYLAVGKQSAMVIPKRLADEGTNMIPF